MSELHSVPLEHILAESEERWRKWAWALTALSLAFLCAGRILDKRATLLHNLREHDMWVEAGAGNTDSPHGN